MKGWKVVRKIGNKFFSLYENDLVAVEYSPGKPARPKKGCGPLAVFSTKEAAERLMGEEGKRVNLVIFPCRYIPSRAKSLWDKSGSRVPLGMLHEGSRLAQEVILESPMREPDPEVIKGMADSIRDEVDADILAHLEAEAKKVKKSKRRNT